MKYLIIEDQNHIEIKELNNFHRVAGYTAPLKRQFNKTNYCFYIVEWLALDNQEEL